MVYALDLNSVEMFSLLVKINKDFNQQKHFKMKSATSHKIYHQKSATGIERTKKIIYESVTFSMVNTARFQMLMTNGWKFIGKECFKFADIVHL